MPNSDSPELLDRFRAGDEAAFDAIVTAHRGTLYAMARRILGNHEDADEAAQLAFVRAWKSRERFRGDSGLRTWLVRIVLNVAKSMRVRTKQHDTLEELAEVASESLAGDDRVHRSQVKERVRRAVEALPPRQREVVLLKVFSELTHREVAAAMELSEGAVKAHLHQAVSNLRRTLNKSGSVEVTG